MNESKIPPVHLDVAKLMAAKTLGLLSLKHGRRVDIADMDGEVIGPSIMRLHVVTTAGDKFYVDWDMSRAIELALADCGVAH